MQALTSPLKFLVIAFPVVLSLVCCQNGPKWQSVSSKDGFVIEFPGQPKDTNVLEGVALSHKYFYQDLDAEQNGYYSIESMDLPSGNVGMGIVLDPCEMAQRAFKTDMELYAAQLGATLRNDSVVVTMNGKRAREFKVDFSDKSGVVIVRKLCTGEHVYTLMVISHASQENNELKDHFFNSFHVND